MIPDHYQTLGISITASKSEIQRAFRKLALKLHPDKNDNLDAKEKFIEINEAYLLLSDTEAREKYNKAYRAYEKGSLHKHDMNYTYSSKEEPKFEDEELNKWTKNARRQAEAFSSMNFPDFSKIILGMVKETGFQLGNSLLIMLGAFLSMGGCGNIFFGLTSKGTSENLLSSIVLLIIGLIVYRFAQKNYKKHKSI
jgi:curved DNA-binding protein CbpA